MNKICIVTTRHISYNPRVLKEADALHAKGYVVSVVTINNQPEQHRFDEELMRSRKWKLKTVNFRKEETRERLTWMYASVRQRLFGYLSKITFKFGIAERAAEKVFSELTALATAERADFYLVHHAEALGAGFRAARSNKARLGFDAEDFHTGMLESPGRSSADDLIAYLEGRYLPCCDYMTAASKGIALAYTGKYGIARPEVILNVFPSEELPVRLVDDPVRFYWYSQVIGPNRGIELLLEAAGRKELAELPFEIHLRGHIGNTGYRDTLMQLAGKGGIRERLFIHEPILAERIVSDGAQFDVGMALESDISVNRNICVTNKIFSYLMSGLLIVGTDTYGQKDIFGHFPDAVRICRMNDAADLAGAMRFCILHKDEVLEGKKAAAKAAKQSFNWELESEKLKLYVDTIFNL